MADNSNPPKNRETDQDPPGSAGDTTAMDRPTASTPPSIPSEPQRSEQDVATLKRLLGVPGNPESHNRDESVTLAVGIPSSDSMIGNVVVDEEPPPKVQHAEHPDRSSNADNFVAVGIPKESEPITVVNPLQTSSNNNNNTGGPPAIDLAVGRYLTVPGAFAEGGNGSTHATTGNASDDDNHAVPLPPEPVLLEANLVDESQVVLAEPLELPRGDGSSDTAVVTAAQEKIHRQRMLVLVLLLIVLFKGGIVLAIVLTRGTASSNNWEDDSLPPQSNSTVAADEMTEEQDSSMSFLPDYTKESLRLDGLRQAGQTHAWEWLQNHTEYETLLTWRKRQLMGLATLYFATGGDSLWNIPPVRETWLNTNLHECDWIGRHTDPLPHSLQLTWWSAVSVNCTPEGVVTNLTLQNVGMRGSLPPEISLLTELKALFLKDNFITGTLPTQLGALTALTHLDLMNNLMEGPLPSQLYELTHLKDLSLEKNAFAGNLMASLPKLTALSTLAVAQNQFTGTLTPELTVLSNLTTLDIWGNAMTGSIPSELGHLSRLTDLKADGNDLTGTLPTQLGDLTELLSLEVYQTDITGTIPSEIGKLTALTSFRVLANRLTSTIPTEFSLLTDLVTVAFGDNRLTGSLPDLSQLTAVTSFNGKDNLISGQLPTNLDSMTSLLYFWMFNNSLTGPVPSQLGLMTQLMDIRMEHNQLTGPIYPTLGSLGALRHIHFQNNSITGTVPESVCDSLILVQLLVDCEEVNCTCSQCVDCVVADDDDS